jgi:hypothetical protein
MSYCKTEQFKKEAETRAHALQKAAQVAEAAKKKAIKEANAQMGLCGIIAIAIVLTAIVFPLAGVLVLFA